MITLLLFVACSGPTPTPAPSPTVAPEAPAPDRAVLAPSPLELRAQVQRAGIEAHLEQHVPRGLPASLESPNADLAALSTGFLFAHTVLGGPRDKAVLVNELRGLQRGLTQLKADPARLERIERAIEQVENDTLAQADFVALLDAEVRSIELDVSWGPSAEVGPMLQAGAWLAGIHLVACAVVDSADPAAAQALLARPAIARWFLGYLKTDEGHEKLGPTGKAVRGALAELEAVFTRETIGLDGAAEVKAITGKLLELAQ